MVPIPIQIAMMRLCVPFEEFEDECMCESLENIEESNDSDLTHGPDFDTMDIDDDHQYTGNSRLQTKFLVSQKYYFSSRNLFARILISLFLLFRIIFTQQYFFLVYL